jgi:hypothetical protein
MNKKDKVDGGHSHQYAKVALAVLIVVLLVLCVFLVRQVQQYHGTPRRGPISAERMHFASLVQQHSLTAGDVDLIQPWMTFDYVSVSFNVPASYIATALGIASTTFGYPNITLGHYARMISTTSTAFIASVRAAVQTYLAPPPSGQ